MSLHPEASRTLAVEAAKLSYPMGVAAAVVAGATLDDLVKITAILAALLSAGYTAWKWWRDAHRAKRERASKVVTVTTPAPKE